MAVIFKVLLHKRVNVDFIVEINGLGENKTILKFIATFRHFIESSLGYKESFLFTFI